MRNIVTPYAAMNIMFADVEDLRDGRPTFVTRLYKFLEVMRIPMIQIVLVTFQTLPMVQTACLLFFEV